MHVTDEEKPVKPKRKRSEGPAPEHHYWTDEKKAINKEETQLIKDKMNAVSEKVLRGEGRETTYDPKIARRFCDIVSTTVLSVPDICKANKDFPVASAIYSWIIRHPEFEDMYRSAKRHQMDLIIEEVIPISDIAEGEFVDQVKIQHAKLRIDTRKWVASKLAPRVYGDTPKIDEKTSQETFLQLQATIDALIKKNAKEY